MDVVVDLYPIYPGSLIPRVMSDIRKFYINTYQDQFFTRPPSWFTMYMWMEALYHLPLSCWAVGALLRGMYLALMTSLSRACSNSCRVL